MDFKKAVETALPVFIELDRDSLHLSYVSPAITALSGYSVKEWLQQAFWLDCVHASDCETLIETIRTGHGEVNLEFRLIKKNGEICWTQCTLHFFPSGDTNNAYGVLTDINTLKQKALNAEQNLEEILEQSATVVYRCDPTGEFPATFISSNVNRQMGYTPENFLDDSAFWANHIHPEDKERVFSQLGCLFEHDFHSHEYRFLHADGKYRWMHDQLRLIRNHEGEPLDIVGNWVDISASKELQIEKEKLEQKMYHARKMQAVGTLAGGVAHEFNNMLGIIIGNTELAMINTDSDISKNLERILTAADRSKELVKQLLSFSHHKQTRKCEPMDLCNLLSEETDFLQSSVFSGIKLDIDTENQKMPVLVDPGEFKQILFNLVSNAAFAMKMHGTVNISLNQVSITRQEHIGLLELNEGNYIQLEVKDKGCGMSPAELSRIFEPFYTTKEVGIGTGLGLSVVYGIMQSYGGGISVESGLDEGSCFRLYFPAISSPADTRTKKHILFVDDEPMYGELAETILRNLGYEVTATNSSLNALQIYKNNSELFDLIITDQLMPEMVGTQLSKEILSINSKAKIILCTGCDIDNLDVQSIGIKNVVMKPFSQSEIEKRIQDLFKNNSKAA